MKQFNKRPYRLVTRALLMGEEAVGALVEWVLGEVQHDNILLDLEPYLGVRGALPVLLLLLLGHSFGLDLWGAFEADFYPGPSVGHHRQRYVWRWGLLLRIRLVIPLKHPMFHSLLGRR